MVRKYVKARMSMARGGLYEKVRGCAMKAAGVCVRWRLCTTVGRRGGM